jgi:hypothetical protein
VVEAGHGGEVGRVDIGSIGSGDETVGVGGVADDARLDVLVGVLVHRLADSGKDGSVVLITP